MQTGPSNHPNPMLRLTGALLVVCTLVLTGCEAAMKLQQAQDAHKRGAELENQAFYEQHLTDQLQNTVDTKAPVAMIPTTDRPETHYAVALEILKALGGAGSPGEQELAQDGLLGIKLLLEAKCQYELGHYTQALPTAKRAASVIDREKLPREWVIATALPAVIINDEVYEKLAKTPSQLTGEQARKRLLEEEDSAESYLKAAQSAAKGKPVEVWLQQVDLALYINFVKAAGRTNNPILADDGTLWAKLFKKCADLTEAVEKHTGKPQLASELTKIYYTAIFAQSNPPPTRP